MNDYKLIALYFYIEDCYNKELCWYCQRFSNNKLEGYFTDIELLTVYIYCISEEEKTRVKSIHRFAEKYLLSWFPDLPSYQAFNKRLNRLCSVFPYLVSSLIPLVEAFETRYDISLIDSLPIITCSGKRRGKVANQLTDKGYCSTKRLHYFGCKLHAMGFHRKGKLPLPEFFQLGKASEHDLTAMELDIGNLHGRSVFGDKAYSKKGLNEKLEEENDSYIYTPVKLVKGESDSVRQFKHAADKLFSTSVSRIRQPIESLFNWLIEKTDIQRASKVRSAKGLIVHVFGKIAAAITLWCNF